MSDQFKQVQQRLLERRAELQKRVQKITDDVRHVSGPLSSDFAEQAVEREGEEVLDALGEAGRIELRKISRALSRIETGDYGVCVSCGEEIPPSRLDVLPFSDQCVVCAEAGEPH